MGSRVWGWLGRREEPPAGQRPQAPGGLRPGRVLAREGGVAVLVDADNVAPAKIGAVLEAVAAEHGPVRIRRAYGDWDREHLTGWRAAVLAHSIRRIDAIAFRAGKQCTDHVMVADAVHLALTENVSVMVLVTSDGDFTDLAMRLREYGVRVEGFGNLNTGRPFRRACEKFTVLDQLTKAPAGAPVVAAAPSPAKPGKKKNVAKTADVTKAVAGRLDPQIAEQLCAMVAQVADADGLVQLTTACHRLHQHGALKAKLNGQTDGKTGRFLKRCGLFEVIDKPGNNGVTVTYLRVKPHP